MKSLMEQLFTNDMYQEDTIYCPVCQRELDAINTERVNEGLDDSYIFVHDDIEHADNDIEALSYGVQ